MISAKGIVFCGSRYIGKIKKCPEVRWNGHNNPTKLSEPWKHLPSNISDCFTQNVILNAPKMVSAR